MSVWEELRAAASKIRSVPACQHPDTCGGCVSSEEQADWLDHTADNMQDEQAREVTLHRADGSTYTEVQIDGVHHTGLTWEWTSALATARRINALDLAALAEPDPDAVDPVISDAAQRVLNSLAWRLDDRRNPELGVAWALRQDTAEVASVEGPNAEGEWLVELHDGSLILWSPTAEQWVVTVSDDTEAVT